MQISVYGTTVYLYVSGLGTDRPLRLSEHVELLPARCALTPEAIVDHFKSEPAIGVAALFLRQVASQLRVSADTPENLVVKAWNALWDAILLGAFSDCEAVCNFQSDSPADELTRDSRIEVTNYQLRGLVESPHMLSETESAWTQQHFVAARHLLDKDQFKTAIHSLASYRWHSLPRARLALLWAGIEGLFEVDSEVVFRVSLYASRFLHPADRDAQQETFRNVKRLYKQRSAAVHGSPIKGDVNQAVSASAALLLSLLRRCAETGQLPQVDTLAP